MRSDVVYSANLQIENRFLLASTVMKAVRKLHITSTRTEDTANSVFSEVARGRYCDTRLPEIEPPPAIDLLPIVTAA